MKENISLIENLVKNSLSAAEYKEKFKEKLNNLLLLLKKDFVKS